MDKSAEMPFWLRASLRLNAVVMTASVLYLWIDGWRRLLRFWDFREKNKNYFLLFGLVFAAPVAAIYLYFQEDNSGNHREDHTTHESATKN
ncbi:MAG: hypothetical protein JNG82_03160 [Opitutaceae bacterium]|nr:hypothetical protein [Opitutaceae bacterium]